MKKKGSCSWTLDNEFEGRSVFFFHRKEEEWFRVFCLTNEDDLYIGTVCDHRFGDQFSVARENVMMFSNPQPRP